MTEMLQAKDADTRVHAFDLLFNLSIHINLYEEIKLEESPPSPPLPDSPPPSPTNKSMELLQANLYSLLSDMLLCITILVVVAIAVVV